MRLWRLKGDAEQPDHIIEGAEQHPGPHRQHHRVRTSVLDLPGGQTDAQFHRHPQLGQLAVPENQDKWDLLQQLWRLLRGKDMAGDVQSIDLTDTGRITLRYLDRFDVVLKSDDDLDYRLNYLAAVIQRLDGSDQGTIQWDKDGKARFIPG